MNPPTTRRSFDFRFAKISLIVFQILWIIFAVILLAYGVAGLAFEDRERPEEREDLRTRAIILVVIGAIGLLVDVVGLVGSIRDNCILTLVFAVTTFLCVVIVDVVSGEHWSVRIVWSVPILAFLFVYQLRKVADKSTA